MIAISKLVVVIKNSRNQLPYSDFSEVVAVIEYDNYLKSALYSDLMFIETAIKNIVCNESVKGLKLGTFEHIYKERMRDNTTNTNLQSKRLKLRNSVYSKLSARYHDEEQKDNQMVRHFYDKGEDAPLWVVFEILYLSDLASFFECLNKTIRAGILNQLNMFDSSVDTNSNLLSIMLYTLKALRNSIEKETGIQNITLYSLIDYIIIVCCLLQRIDFSGNRSKLLLQKYKEHNRLLQHSVTPSIYSQIVQQNVEAKIIGLEKYLNI